MGSKIWEGYVAEWNTVWFATSNRLLCPKGSPVLGLRSIANAVPGDTRGESEHPDTGVPVLDWRFTVLTT